MRPLRRQLYKYKEAHTCLLRWRPLAPLYLHNGRILCARVVLEYAVTPAQPFMALLHLTYAVMVRWDISLASTSNIRGFPVLRARLL
jgi:hypothetical protein